MLIYHALLDAASRLPASVQPGILIDEQYGAAIAELAAGTDGAISLAMPVEASGGPWLRYAYDDWYFVDARDGTLPVQYEPETL